MLNLFKLYRFNLIKEPQNDTVIVEEPPPPPAKITAPLELYEEDSEDFPEDIYEQQLELQLQEEEKKKALREKVYFFLYK